MIAYQTSYTALQETTLFRHVWEIKCSLKKSNILY